MKMNKKLIWIAPLAVVAIPAFIAAGGEVVRLLWNYLCPALFGWPRVTFWQALALLALTRVLFGGLGHPGGNGPRFRRRMEERWDKMTPEEREKFRQRMGRHCVDAPPAGDAGQAA